MEEHSAPLLIPLAIPVEENRYPRSGSKKSAGATLLWGDTDDNDGLAMLALPTYYLPKDFQNE